jgi:hypothetical protein
MVKTSGEEEEEDEGKVRSKKNPLRFSKHFNITQKDLKKMKVQSYLLKKVLPLESNVETTRECSNCGSSSGSSSSKTCLLSWCNATSSSFNGNPL